MCLAICTANNKGYLLASSVQHQPLLALQSRIYKASIFSINDTTIFIVHLYIKNNTIMKHLYANLFLILLLNTAFAQDATKMRIMGGTENKDLQAMMSFEGIAIDKFEFSGKQLIGKDYDFKVKEFKNGKLVGTTLIMDSKEDDYFKIKKDTFKFRMLTKVEDEKKFKIEIAFAGFTSKKLVFDLFDKNGRYAMKTFLGSKTEINLLETGKFYIMALITPTLHKDKSSSYCEVAQSGIDPEKLNEKYNIPHYFLIEMTLK
jgi:hypothetical protein